jgi:hypothetical protein
LYPEADVYGLLEVPPDAGLGYRLDDAALQARVAAISQRIVSELNMDGVVLSILPVSDGNADWLATLRGVRAAIGEANVLAAVVPPDWRPADADVPFSPLYAPDALWSAEYKQSAALLLDQMIILAYNSGLEDAGDYGEWVAYQVRAYTEAIEGLGANISTRLLVGIPTLDSQLPMHDATVENVASALAGIQLATEQLGASASLIQGVTLYTSATTDESEWGAYEQGWSSRN